MQRPIKFRAWDKVMNEMFYDSELSNGDLLVIHMDGRLELSDDDTYKISDVEIMLEQMKRGLGISFYCVDKVKSKKLSRLNDKLDLVDRGGK